MSKHEKLTKPKLRTSFKAASLSVHPSILAIACHLARIAAEEDLKIFAETGKIPYSGPEEKGGPQ